MNSELLMQDAPEAAVLAPSPMGELFGRLDAELARSSDLEATLTECARLIRAGAERVADPALRAQMRASSDALELHVAGDPSGLGWQFDSLINPDPATVDDERFLALLVKNVVDDSRFDPLIMHCRLNPRVQASQAVLRDPEFVQVLAERLGQAWYPPEILQTRVQGVEEIHTAGHRRYALFADFISGLGRDGCDTRGGLMFNVITDEFIDGDLRVAAELFPDVLPWLDGVGALEREVLYYLFPIFLTLHDTLGHTLPNSLNHPVKGEAGGFLCDPLEEVGADAQFFWVTTSPRMRPFLRRIMTDDEADALSVVWLLKRVCGYPRRGFGDDPVHGRLMTDADSRTGVLLWNFFRAEGVIRPDGDAWRLDRSALPAASSRLLDEWLDVESHIGEGVERYRAELARFADRFGTATPDGSWEIPEPLRRAFREAGF